MNPRTVVQCEKCFRDVCAEHLRRNPPIIGGFLCEVEIEKPWLLASRGDAVELPSPLFGGGMPPLSCVSSRTGELTLTFLTLPLGYRHLQVNHQLNFVDLRTGAHTQHVESLWQNYKEV
ncbi:unnamed protein product [Haemonchus placei]|uniref:TAXi_C domain-containing protein n=1 Tax=Haemonchus placei TaxID=6290 RepID=A0A0N4W2H3_HAEPC|nr:unnamed protein product [Haemonchus placei]